MKDSTQYYNSLIALKIQDSMQKNEMKNNDLRFTENLKTSNSLNNLIKSNSDFAIESNKPFFYINNIKIQRDYNFKAYEFHEYLKNIGNRTATNVNYLTCIVSYEDALKGIMHCGSESMLNDIAPGYDLNCVRSTIDIPDLFDTLNLRNRKRVYIFFNISYEDILTRKKYSQSFFNYWPNPYDLYSDRIYGCNKEEIKAIDSVLLKNGIKYSK